MIVIIICEQCIHHNSYTIIIIMTIIIICVRCDHHHDYDYYHLYTLSGLVVCPTPHVRRYPWTLTISNNFPLTFPGLDNSTTLLPWLPASPTTWEKSCCKTTTLASYWPWPHQIADDYYINKLLFKRFWGVQLLFCVVWTQFLHLLRWLGLMVFRQVLFEFIWVFATILSSLTNSTKPKLDWTQFIQNSSERKPGQVIDTLHSLSSGNVRTAGEEDSGGELRSGLSAFTAEESAEKETLAWSSSSTDTSLPTFSGDQCKKSSIKLLNIGYFVMVSHLADVIWPKACYNVSFLWQLWHKVCHLLTLRIVVKLTMYFA